MIQQTFMGRIHVSMDQPRDLSTWFGIMAVFLNQLQDLSIWSGFLLVFPNQVPFPDLSWLQLKPIPE